MQCLRWYDYNSRYFALRINTCLDIEILVVAATQSWLLLRLLILTGSFRVSCVITSFPQLQNTHDNISMLSLKLYLLLSST